MLRRLLGDEFSPCCGGTDPQRYWATCRTELVSHTLDHFRQEEEPGHVRRVLLEEEHRFGRLMERGRKVAGPAPVSAARWGEHFHHLHDTHGLP